MLIFLGYDAYVQKDAKADVGTLLGQGRTGDLASAWAAVPRSGGRSAELPTVPGGARAERCDRTGDRHPRIDPASWRRGRVRAMPPRRHPSPQLLVADRRASCGLFVIRSTDQLLMDTAAAPDPRAVPGFNCRSAVPMLQLSPSFDLVHLPVEDGL